MAANLSNYYLNKWVTQRCDIQRSDQEKLHEAEVKKQYQAKISKRFIALENLDDNTDISQTWENVTENI